MNTPLKAALAAGILSMTLVACNKSTDKNPLNNIQEAAQDPDLQGKIFRGECSARVLESLASSIATAGSAVVRSAREQYQFAGNNLTHATLLYSSTDCTGTESLIFKETGTFDIPDADKTADGGSLIDLKYDHVSAKANDESGAKLAQEISLCGTDQWAVGTENDVTAHSADLTCYRKNVPAADAQLYKLDGADLYFGEKKVGERNTERPAQIDNDQKYTH